MSPEGLHLARLVLLYAGGLLTSRGYIDAATAEALLGIGLAAAGAGWSWLARKRLQAKAGEPLGWAARQAIRVFG
jgi:hypothetical protein